MAHLSRWCRLARIDMLVDMDSLKSRRLFAISLAVLLPVTAHALGAGVFAFCIAAGVIGGVYYSWDKLNA